VAVSVVGPEYLRAAAANPAIRELKRRSYELLGVSPGSRVIDVGCGPGIDTSELGLRVGATGQVVGIDHDPAMVTAADAAARGAGVSGWTRHQVAVGTALPFAAASFDAARCERMFQHLADPGPALALAELRRVTRPGGRVVVADTDWGTLSVDLDDVELERRIVRLHASRFWNGFAGRRLRRLFVTQGLAPTEVETFVVLLELPALLDLLAGTEQYGLATGLITAHEWRRWRQSLWLADAVGGHFAQLNIVLVASTVPAGGS
jgi:SAM-dependent methyltransferase